MDEDIIELDVPTYDEHIRNGIDRLVLAEHFEAAENGNLSLLIRLQKETGTVGNTYVLGAAAYEGHLDVVKYMHSQGVSLEYFHMYNACKCGSIPLIQYLLDMDVEYNDYCFQILLLDDHLEALRYLLERGIPEEYDALEEAVRHGKLEAVKLLHSHGYKITELSIRLAIIGIEDDSLKYKEPKEEVYLGILIYLLSHYNVKSEHYFDIAINNNKVEIATWLANNGYPVVYVETDNFQLENLQHQLGLMDCYDVCIYCTIAKIKMSRRCLYSEDGYGTWLSYDIIERLIDRLY